MTIKSNILALDTSTNICSIALMQSDDITYQNHWDLGKLTIEFLPSKIQEALNSSNTVFSDIDWLCVSRGPGSYTGTRIAFSYLQGVSLAKGMPIASIRKDDAIAWKYRNLSPLVTVILDTGRNYLWCANYACSLETIDLIDSPKVFAKQDLTVEDNCKVISEVELNNMTQHTLYKDNIAVDLALLLKYRLDNNLQPSIEDHTPIYFTQLAYPSD